jgi:hypothetical protein
MSAFATTPTCGRIKLTAAYGSRLCENAHAKNAQNCFSIVFSKPNTAGCCPDLVDRSIACPGHRAAR